MLQRGLNDHTILMVWIKLTLKSVMSIYAGFFASDEYCFPRQAACVPLALTGRDICGSAVTGSGKVKLLLSLSLNTKKMSKWKTWWFYLFGLLPDCCFCIAITRKASVPTSKDTCNSCLDIDTNKGTCSAVWNISLSLSHICVMLFYSQPLQ